MARRSGEGEASCADVNGRTMKKSVSEDCAAKAAQRLVPHMVLPKHEDTAGAGARRLLGRPKRVRRPLRLHDETALKRYTPICEGQ